LIIPNFTASFTTRHDYGIGENSERLRPRRLARRMVLASRRPRICSKWKGAMRPLAIVFLIAAPILAQNLTTHIDNQLSGLLDIYKDIHAHPELSHQESRTSALLANELRSRHSFRTPQATQKPPAAEGMAVEAKGVIYGAEVVPNDLKRYVRQ
jgi:hypothetical protein